MQGPKNVGRGDNLYLRFSENLGGLGNPFSVIGVNAKSTTNFRS